MIPVEEARARIVKAMRLMPAETVGLERAAGRTLAHDVRARRTQPPIALSAMDGWAVRAADVAEVPVVLKKIGEAPAGYAFKGAVGRSEAVRIFTGAPVPDGADCIVIQENTEPAGDGNQDKVRIMKSAAAGNYIRPAGLDFSTGDVGVRAGKRLGPRDIGLAAAMDVPWLQVRRRPRIALLATGDELVRPGEPIGPNQIVSSNALSLAALIEQAGGSAIDLGIARDDRESLGAMAAGARGADMLVTLGGASVGEHDLVQAVLGEQGLNVDFWRIAMRPGKPLIFGALGETPLLGLPGNPVSALVCGLIYLRPAILAMLGDDGPAEVTATARLAHDLAANDARQDYLRATLKRDADGTALADAFAKQDSSMIASLAGADCLIVRAPHAPAAAAGEVVTILPLAGII